MNIHIIVITYAMVKPLAGLFADLGGPDVLWHVYRHSNRPDVNALIDRLHRDHHIRDNDYRFNRGVALSMNTGLMTALEMKADAIVYTCDDLIATRADLDRMISLSKQIPDAYMIGVRGFDVPTKTVMPLDTEFCVINPIALNTIGYLDENYFPAYYEDQDWRRRATLAGLTQADVFNTEVIHLGSRTYKTVPELETQQQITYPANQRYYIQKWGGDIGHETFTFPFNDPRFDLKIRAEDRHNPYPPYQRTDWGIVKI